MSLANRISIVLVCFAVLGITTGCVGPLGCGPGGARGPLAFNSCDGCGDCEGCGELYIDPWINEPADCCDPCDRCGNYNGQSCGKCRSVFDGFASLWGYRCDEGCDSCGSGSCDGGCDAIGCDPGCGCESCASVGADAIIPIAGDPKPAKQIVKAKPAAQPYKPTRTRQIFKPRGSIADGKAISIER